MIAPEKTLPLSPKSCLYSDRLFAIYRHRSQPAVAIVFFATHDGIELFLDRLRDRAGQSLADFDLVDGTDGRNLGGRAGEECFVGNVEHFARNHLLDDGNVQVTRDLQHGIAGDAWEHGVAQRRGDQFVAMSEEYVLARAFADIAVHVESNSFGVAIDDSFHLDELRVHVIGARLGHRRQGVRSKTRPGGDAGVATFALSAQIFSPGIVDDVNLSRRVERIHPCLAVAAEDDGPHIAWPRAVTANGFKHGFHQLVASVIHVDAIDLGRIKQALDVFIGAENRGTRFRVVAADSLEYRGAIVDHVRHHVNRRFIPGNELAIVPDIFRLLDCHADSFSCDLRNEAESVRGARRENPTSVTEHYSPSRSGTNPRCNMNVGAPLGECWDRKKKMWGQPSSAAQRPAGAIPNSECLPARI